MIPITVNGQQQLFDPEITMRELREALDQDQRLRGNRDGLFTEPTGEAEVSWP